MYKLNKILMSLLVVLLLVGCTAGIAAADLNDSALSDDGSGSGVVSDDDGSASEGSSYDDKSNVGVADSQDDPLDEPLDDDYFSSSSSSSSSGGSFTVSLSKHATGNPLFMIVLVLLSIGGLYIRRC